MPSLPIKILGLGKYLPKDAVSAQALNERLGLPEGWVEARSGVLTRHFVTDETASQMGAHAAQAALADAGLDFSDIDCLVCASGSREQAIPCTAALIQKAMGQGGSGVPAFDVDSTCLSFVVAFDLMSQLVAAGRYKRVLIVSSEVASRALDWKSKESCTILGDGAAAAVIGLSAAGEGSRVLGARLETYSEHAGLTEARGGGSRYHPRDFDGTLEEYVEAHCLFDMDGKAVFKVSAQILPGFVDRLLADAGCTLSELALVIPHQASLTALWLMQRKLNVPRDRWMVIAHDHGNTIAASIPLGLYEAVAQGRLRRGDRAMLLGTSAGFSVGGLIFDY